MRCLSSSVTYFLNIFDILDVEPVDTEGQLY